MNKTLLDCQSKLQFNAVAFFIYYFAVEEQFIVDLCTFSSENKATTNENYVGGGISTFNFTNGTELFQLGGTINLNIRQMHARTPRHTFLLCAKQAETISYDRKIIKVKRYTRITLLYKNEWNKEELRSGKSNYGNDTSENLYNTNLVELQFEVKWYHQFISLTMCDCKMLVFLC